MRRLRGRFLRRLCAAAVLVVVGVPATPALASTSLVPRTPEPLRAFVSPAGVGLKYVTTSYGQAPTSFRLYRRAPGVEAWTLLREFPRGVAWTAAQIDETLPPGESAEYAWSAVNPAGESPLTAPLPVQRPISVPVAGGTDAITLDTDPTNQVVSGSIDASRSGEQVRAEWDTIAGTVAGNSLPVASSTLPLVPGPGVYRVGPDDTAETTKLQLGADGWSCQAASGTITVHQAVFDAALEPVVYAADFDVVCGYQGTTAHGSIRWHSTLPYRHAESPRQLERTVPVGKSGPLQDVPVRNRGAQPVTLGTAAVRGAQSFDWTIATDGCAGTTLQPTQSCLVQVRFAPTGTGERSALVAVPDDTARGERLTRLVGTGGTVPGPVFDADVATSRTRALLGWYAPSDDGRLGIDGYRVYRTESGSRRLVSTVPAGRYWPEETQAQDATLVPGAPYRYEIVAYNAAGEGPPVVKSGTAARTELLVVSAPGDDGARGLYAQGEWEVRVPIEVDGTDHVDPASSPGGRDVVYARAATRTGQHDLWIRSGDGGPARRLTSTAADESRPTWSPDGRTIAFASTTAGRAPDIYTVPASGGTPTLRGPAATDPAFLSDNKTLIATDRTVAYGPLLRLGTDGSRRKLTNTGTGGSGAAVSPDGLKIAYSALGSGGRGRLAVIDAAAAGRPQVVQTLAPSMFGEAPDESYAITRPRWSADGQTLFAEFGDDDGPGFVVRSNWDPAARLWKPLVMDRPWDGIGFDSGPTPREVGLRITAAGVTRGTATSVAFTVDEAVAGTTTTCALDGAAPVPCASPFTATRGLGDHRVLVTAAGPGRAPTSTAFSWTVTPIDVFASTQPAVGTPTSEEYPVGAGRARNYTGGRVYWSAATGAHVVKGLILDRYLRLGGPAGFLGFPRTDEMGTPDRIGRYNHFAGGSVYWTATTGAHELHGLIRDRWAALGWERSRLGYPTSDEYGVTFGRKSNFQRGEIFWNAWNRTLSVTYR